MLRLWWWWTGKGISFGDWSIRVCTLFGGDEGIGNLL